MQSSHYSQDINEITLSVYVMLHQNTGRSQNWKSYDPTIVQTKAPKSVNLCRLHNFFPGTPHPPPCYSFDPEHLIPWPGSSFWAPSAQMSCLLKKCINASLRMCFNQWYQCLLTQLSVYVSRESESVSSGSSMYFTSFVYDLVEIRGGGKIQIRPDPQKFFGPAGPQNKDI